MEIAVVGLVGVMLRASLVSWERLGGRKVEGAGRSSNGFRELSADRACGAHQENSMPGALGTVVPWGRVAAHFGMWNG